MARKPENIRLAETFVADGDLSAKDGYFTKPGTNDEDVALASVQGAKSLGMIIDGSTDGRAVTVLREGEGYAEAASATYTFDQDLAVGITGKLEAAASGDYVVAKARESSSAGVGDPIVVEIINPNYKI